MTNLRRDTIDALHLQKMALRRLRHTRKGSARAKLYNSILRASRAFLEGKKK